MTESMRGVIAVLAVSVGAAGGCDPALDDGAAAGAEADVEVEVLEEEEQPAAELLAGPAPDYLIAEMVEPANIVAGFDFSISATVENVGDADATAESTLAFVLSVDPVRGGGDVILRPRPRVAPLAIGASAPTTVVMTPPRIEPGSYFLIACADRDREIVEANEQNNCTASDGPIPVRSVDLEVRVDEPPPHLLVRSSVTFSDTTRNRGDGALRGGTLVTYFLSPVPRRVPESIQILPERQTGPIAAGSASSGSVVYRVPFLPDGDYFLVACADSMSRIPEPDESNNCDASSGTTGFGPADLVVSSLVDPPPRVIVGDSFPAIDTTSNTGDRNAFPSTVTRYFLSLDQLPGDDVALEGGREVPPLPIDLSSVGTAMARVPLATPPGSYFLLACADADGALAERSDSNNCRPSAAPVTVIGLDATCGDDTGGIVVDEVVTSGGFTQIAQGQAEELVITGGGLDLASTVTVGDFAATVLSATAGELRARIAIPHGAPPGPRPITVRALPEPGCTVFAALEVTPIVVSPTSSVNGRGTFQSPMTLCALTARAAAGDTIILLAGEHACGEVIDLDGVQIAGQGLAATAVTARFRIGASRARPVSIRDLSLTAANPDPTPLVDVHLEGDNGEVSLQDLSLDGGGISVSGPSHGGHATLTRVVIAGASTAFRAVDSVAAVVTEAQISNCSVGIAGARALNHHGARLILTDVSITGCQTGVLSQLGGGEATRLHVTDCDVGIDLTDEPPPASFPESVFWRLTDGVLHDNTIGARVKRNLLFTTNTVITGDDATPRPSERGVLLLDGQVDWTGGAISGQELAGVELTAADPSRRVALRMHGAVIEGGARGVHAHGPAGGGNTLILESSTIRDQTIASVTWDIETQFLDVRMAGDNRLSVLPGGFALEDLRTVRVPSFQPIQAAGITLNDQVFSPGLRRGPRSNPPRFRILAGGAILF